jgi:hypothetical protein
MNARSAAVAAGLCLLAITAGCIPPNGSLTAQRAADKRPISIDNETSPTTADAQDVQTVGDVEPGMEPVQRWIEQIDRIDDLHARVARQSPEEDISPATERTYGQSPTMLGAPPEDSSINPSDGPPATQSSAVPAAEPQSSILRSDVAPVLGRVTARAAEPPPQTPAPAGDGAPSVNAPAEAAGQPPSIQELAEQWLAQPTDTSYRAQLDRRVLLVLSGNYEEARRPLELVSTEQQQLATQFVEALIAIREGHGGDPAAEANAILARIEALAESLVPLSDLRISDLALTRAVRGFGRYEALDPPELLTGRENEFVVYCEVQNFLSRPAADGSYESLFSLRTTVLNRAGDVVLELNDEHIADKCRTRRHDCFIPRLVRLPATLSPGEYVVKTTIVDKIGKKVAEKRTTFRIVARS